MGTERGIVFICALLLLSACTPLQPMGLGWDIAADCETVDCVVDRVDQAEPQKGKRYLWMEGYRDVNLRYMRDNGLLKIKITNPFLIVMGVYGLADVWYGEYGDVARCDVLYTPSPAWRTLVHELSHCKGFTDRFPVVHPGDYTPAQKEIIRREGKARWVDTEFYKQEKFLVNYSAGYHTQRRPFIGAP